MATAVNNQIGIGSRLSEVQQQFCQGTITTTNQALDVAINGNGFFQLSNNGSTVYSRNGVFHLDDNGKIVNSCGPAADGLCGGLERHHQQREHRAADRADVEHRAGGDQERHGRVQPEFAGHGSDRMPSASAMRRATTRRPPIDMYDSLGGTQKVSVYFVKNSTGSWNAYAGYGDPVQPVPATAPSTATDGLIGTVSSTRRAT